MVSKGRGEYKLRLFENKFQMRKFRKKMAENREWERLHNEELYSFTVHL